MLIARWTTPSTFLALFVLATVAQAQDKVAFDDLPKAVKTTVKNKYPEAKIKAVIKELNEEKEQVYEVEMLIKGKTCDIIITPKGEIEIIEEEVDADDLPKPVVATFKKTFPKGKIDKAEKVTDEDKKVTYEVFVKVGTKEPFEVLMAADGKILKNGADTEKSEKKESKEKGEDDEKPKKKSKD